MAERIRKKREALQGNRSIREPQQKENEQCGQEKYRSGHMIINTGNRTDIPGYYSEWFYRRIEEGRVMVRNPYYPEQVIEYRLNPKVVDGN